MNVPRLKLVYTIQRMSSKKIIRLKTPIKHQQYLKTPESTFAQTRFFGLQTVTELTNGQYSETLHNTLIHQINKLYKQTQALKMKLHEEKQNNDQLLKEKKRLRAQIQILQRQSQAFREMYDLEKHNHQRLRDFYEQREKQWQYIVFQHKKMLEEYDQIYHTSLSKIQDVKQPLSQIQSEISPGKNIVKDVEISNPNKIEKKQTKKLKRLHLHENKIQISKNINKDKNSNHQAYYYAQINRLYSEQKQFTKKSQLHSFSSQGKSIKGPIHRNPQVDDLFQRIMRKTYYYFKSQYKTINQIKQCEDMIKLKHAKTSTKQRLLKTIKKLQFQIQSQKQFNIFCDYIQQIVLDREKMLRGDLVYQFLIQKLKQCQGLAESSNSLIDKLQTSDIEKNQSEKTQRLCKQPQPIEIQRVSRENLQLLLNSTIKKPPKSDSQIFQNVRYSISSLQNLSDLIQVQTLGLTIQQKIIETPVLDQTSL